MRVNKHFYLHEFIPRKYIRQFGEKRAFHLVRPELYQIAYELREGLTREYGRRIRISVNNWRLQYRGWRPVDFEEGSPRSYHMLGMAIDVSSPDVSVKEIFDFILNNQRRFRSLGLRRVENIVHTPGWVHLDIGDEIPEHFNGMIYVFDI